MKVICPLCGSTNELETKDLTMTCSHCGKVFNTQEAINNMGKSYGWILANAKRNLYQSLNFEKARELYLQAIEYNEKDMFALSGYIVATLYTNTLRETHFDVVEEVFDKYDVVLDKENSKTYLNLINDIFNQVEYYINNTKIKAMSSNTEFLNEDFYNTYKNSLDVILKMLHFLEDSLSLVDEEELANKKKNEAKLFDKFEEYYSFIEEEKNKEYTFLKEDDPLFASTLAQEAIVYVDKKAKKELYISIGVVGSFLLLFIIFMILYGVLRNFLYLGLGVAALAVGVGVFFLFRYFFKKKMED